MAVRRTSGRRLDLEGAIRREEPLVLGVVNATPDSFSGPGVGQDAEAGERAARAMVAAGAAMVDLGGESTRPGAVPVPEGVELRRVEPLLERIADLPVSIDTRHASVARRALELGAGMVNDVSALGEDPGMVDVLGPSDCHVCLVHMQGRPATMQVAPRYHDVVSEVCAHLESRMAWATARGIAEQRIVLDPGIGFGKRLEDNVALITGLDSLRALGRPVLVGLSRKRSLAALSGASDSRVASLGASVAGALAAYQRGATIIRAHDVAAHVDALRVAAALGLRAPAPVRP